MIASLFLLRRYLKPGNKSRTYTFFSFAALAGIALGVATLVVALSVLEGYEKVISEKLVTFDSDIQIYGYGNQDLPEPEKAEKTIKSIAGNYLNSVELGAQKICILGKNRINEGVTLKGISGDYLKRRDGLKLVSGSFDLGLDADSVNKVIIGKTLATKLRVKTGDMINFFAINAVDLKTMTALPAVENFVVSGIYQTGMGKYDDAFAYTALSELQRLYEMDDKINLIEVKLNRGVAVDSLKNVIQQNLGHPYFAVTFVEANMQMFNWIELQRKPVPIVLGLIIVVAAFNIISALLMLVLDKTNTIGTLKAIGMPLGFIASNISCEGSFAGNWWCHSWGSFRLFTLLFAIRVWTGSTKPSNIFC
ncbi:hypothetical protein MASR1M107_33930 [Ignavibacteriales bacterium]